jgi:hypothetical protein
MTLKGKKLHPDYIQAIRDFVMTYKGLMTFTMSYKELAHYKKYVDDKLNFHSVFLYSSRE